MVGSNLDWVIKRCRPGLPGESLFPNLPESEARALECLQGAEVAPAPVAFYPEDGPALVYEYHPGELWQDGVLGVAQLLRWLHDLPGQSTADFRSLPIRSEEILFEGDGMLPDADSDPWSDRLRSLRPAHAESPPLETRKLIHTDVGAGNIVVGPSGDRLIESAVPGSR